MRLRRMLIVGLVGIAVTGSAAACGEGDTLSKAEYVSELSTMCEDFAVREQAIGEPETIADLVKNGPRIVEAFEQAVAGKVGDLHAPPEIAAEADRLVEIANQQRDVLDELVEAAEKDDLADVQRLAGRNAALNAESSAIARHIGAKSCS
jgi:hypothetical protein